MEGCTFSVCEYLPSLALSQLRPSPSSTIPRLRASFTSPGVMGPDNSCSMCRLLENRTHVQALDISQSIPVSHLTLCHSALSAIESSDGLNMLMLVFNTSPSPTEEALSMVVGLSSLETIGSHAGTRVASQDGVRSGRDHERCGCTSFCLIMLSFHPGYSFIVLGEEAASGCMH